MAATLKRISVHRICQRSLFYKSFHHHHHVHINILQTFQFCASNQNGKDDKKETESTEQTGFFAQIERELKRVKDEINRQQNRNDNENGNNNHNQDSEESKIALHQEWMDRYNAMKSENQFEIDNLTALDWRTQFNYFQIAYMKDPLYRMAMNSWLTGFSDRFLYYEEFSYVFICYYSLTSFLLSVSYH